MFLLYLAFSLGKKKNFACGTAPTKKIGAFDTDNPDPRPTKNQKSKKDKKRHRAGQGHLCEKVP